MFNILIMKILSYDCANRSLAVCYMTVDAKKNNEIKLHMLEVFDLTDNRQLTTVERTILLKQCLKNIDKNIAEFGKPDTVLVEYQMSANDKSRCVSQQIIYNYCLCCPTYLVGPSLKNKIYFADDLKHSVFMAKYATKYTANKNHTKANLLYWLKKNNQEHFIKNIKKKNIDDIADAFMQILGWLNKEKGIAFPNA
jgi:hypothetical protein